MNLSKLKKNVAQIKAFRCTNHQLLRKSCQSSWWRARKLMYILILPLFIYLTYFLNIKLLFLIISNAFCFIFKKISKTQNYYFYLFLTCFILLLKKK